MPSSRQASISRSLLPGPRKMMFSGAAPERRTVTSSAIDDTSTRAPAAWSTAHTPMFGFDLREKKNSSLGCRCSLRPRTRADSSSPS
jgi:hypothetical protein